LTASTGDRRAITRQVRAALRHTRSDLPRLGRLRVGPAGGIAIGLAVGAAAIVAKGGLNALLGGETGYILLIGASALAAWIGGMSGGLSATLMAGLLNAVFFVGPEGPSLGLSGIDLSRTILYVLAGVVVSLLISSLRTSRDRLASTLAGVGALADEVERRDERLEIVLAASGTGFWEWDIRDGSLTWSDAIFRQHGLEPGSTSPSYDAYVATLHPDDRAAFQGAIEGVLASGTSFSQEFRLVWPDGSIHWTHGVGRVFRDAQGAAIRMVGTGTDITERRRLEAERDRLLADERRTGAFREAFLEVISHELRTPITTILGLTQILSRRGRIADPDEQAGLIDDIADESERLHRLVEDLLVLTKAERGEFVVEAEPLELRRLLARVVDREGARLPGLSITAEIPRDLPVVAGEDIYVEQIVRNILGNAAKYTPLGTKVIVRATQEGDSVVIRVLDSGPGIEPDTASRAFELFFRDPTSARSVAGSGIGLFVCASLVEAMGGRIWARPRPEGGSEFGFTLNVLSDDESPEQVAVTPDTTPIAERVE
jgi:PAS domain S-box-containing protein